MLRVPSIEDEDARRLHRELARLKRERLAHRCRIQSLLVIHGVRAKVNGTNSSCLPFSSPRRSPWNSSRFTSGAGRRKRWDSRTRMKRQ